MQLRLNARPQVAILRKQTVEHVFGTLKAWLGTTPLLTKTLPKVRTEISLAVLAYNMLYRSDTKRPLDVVSKRYQVVQPRETERARLQIEQRES